MFSLFYLVIGFEENSTGLLSLYDYFIESWEVSTKGSKHDVTSIWVRESQSEYGFMNIIIMILQISNEIYLKIIMLSFLIAIIKKSFDT